MKEDIQKLLDGIVLGLTDKECSVEILRTKSELHGDWTSNIAMVLSKELNKNPQELAKEIISQIKKIDWLEKVEIAGPGFINFFLTRDASLKYLKKLIQEDTSCFSIKEKEPKNILVEYVSCNPTGPIHVGHGRGAAFGSALSNLLIRAGNKVTQEYYVNDRGLQSETLGLSVFLRYQMLFEIDVNFPDDCYQGDYVKETAAKAKKLFKENFILTNPDDFNKIKNFNEMNAFVKNNFKDFDLLINFSIEEEIKKIKEDLKKFRVNHNVWFNESTLYNQSDSKENDFEITRKNLEATNNLFEKEGATWFRSSKYGDEKDRVFIRENSEPTYFASDIAYHNLKYQRNFDLLINVWGADHHGYLPRIEGAIKALKSDTNILKTIFIQFVSLLRKGKPVSMSTRSGEFITLSSLIDEVGIDAARFFFLARKGDQSLDFDLDVATAENKNNPVYYIQYAYARICSLEKELVKRGMSFDIEEGIENLSKLSGSQESEIISFIESYQDVLEQSYRDLEIHPICFYLRDLASKFHTYYNSEVIIDDDSKTRNAKYVLLLGIKRTIKSGFDLLSISTPEKM